MYGSKSVRILSLCLLHIRCNIHGTWWRVYELTNCRPIFTLNQSRYKNAEPPIRPVSKMIKVDPQFVMSITSLPCECVRDCVLHFKPSTHLKGKGKISFMQRICGSLRSDGDYQVHYIIFFKSITDLVTQHQKWSIF